MSEIHSCAAGRRLGVSSPDGLAPPPGQITVENPPSRDVAPWDPETLLGADPWSLLARLDLTDPSEAGPQARLAMAVYRTSFDAHAARPQERRWLLSLDAARWGATDLLGALADVPAEECPAWRPLWATGAQTDERLRLPWREATFRGVNVHGVIQVDGRPTAVFTSESWGGLRDLETGEQTSSLLMPRESSVLLNSAAIAEVDGRPMVVADGYDPAGKLPTVEVWDAITGEHLGTIPTGHVGMVKVLATAVVNGRATVVSANWDGDLEVRDLLTGDEVCPPLPGADVRLLETAVLDGPSAVFDEMMVPTGDRPLAGGEGATTGGDGFVVVTTGRTKTPRLWRLRAGHPPQPTDGPPVTAWTRVAEETREHLVRLRDLRTGAPVGPPLPFIGAGWGLVATVLRGRTVAVSGAYDGRIRVWDLQTSGDSEPLGRPLPGHTAKVYELTIVPDGDRTTVVSRDEDGGTLARNTSTGQPVGPVGPDARNRAVRVEKVENGWFSLHDPRTGQALGPPLGPFVGTPAAAVTELDGVPVVFTGDWAGSVDLWAVRTGERLPRMNKPTSTVNVVVTWQLDGRPIAVTGSEGGPCRMWDLRESRRLDPPLEARDVGALAVTELDGRTLLATGSYTPYGMVRLFDLRTGEPVGLPARFPEPVHALAWTPEGLLMVAFGPEVAAIRPPPAGTGPRTGRRTPRAPPTIQPPPPPA
ncbi:WD40 repeat domain-containing protein [Streptosporangium sp. G11]|uniref:WD40 repeat domain-containing protein n=1 Tax=Streptosporangium sp. G11 TaxID=3436926 RepID=UPI003EBEA5D6